MSDASSDMGALAAFIAFAAWGIQAELNPNMLANQQAAAGATREERREEAFADAVGLIPRHVEDVAMWMICAQDVQAPLTGHSSIRTSPYVRACGDFPRPPLDNLLSSYGGHIPMEVSERWRWETSQVEHHGYTVQATRWWNEGGLPHLMPRPRDNGISMADALRDTPPR